LKVDAARAREPGASRSELAGRSEPLLRITAAIAEAVSSEQVFEAVVDHVAEVVEASSAALWLVDESAHVARLARVLGYSDTAKARFMAVPLGLSPSIPAMDSIRRREPIWIATQAELIAQYPHLVPVATLGRSYRVSCLPLMAQERVLGTLALTIEESRPPTADERDFLLLIGRYASQALERVRLFEAERRSRAEADAAAQRLGQTLRSHELLAGVLAHDLRNPLGAIRTSAQGVLRHLEGETDRTSKPLNRIITCTEKMTRMVDQLLDFTRARVGGGFELQLRPVDLTHLVHQVVDELEVSKPEWKLEVQRDGDLAGTWDPDRLEQVLSNLISNAGQHGERGTPVRVRLDGTTADVVRVEVHNRGAIPESLQTGLFDPFRRAENRIRQGDGLGLGLFITRELIRAHGGTVALASSVNEGTTLSVCLPRHAVAPGDRER
jgi:signal transduction histidine kinase